MLPAQNYELESFRFQNHNFGGLQQTPTLDHPKGLLEGEQGQGEKQEKGRLDPQEFDRSFYSPKFGEGAACEILKFKQFIKGSRGVIHPLQNCIT